MKSSVVNCPNTFDQDCSCVSHLVFDFVQSKNSFLRSFFVDPLSHRVKKERAISLTLKMRPKKARRLSGTNVCG